jgi:hypothetical protein
MILQMAQFFLSCARCNKCYRSEMKIYSSSQDGANADGETKDTYIGTLPDGTNATELGGKRYF